MQRESSVIQKTGSEPNNFFETFFYDFGPLYTPIMR